MCEKHESCLTLFDHLSNLTQRKSFFNKYSDTSTYIPYMINRYISMVQPHLQIVNDINRFDLPKYIHYKYYLALLPKKYQYFDYIKKKKDIDHDKKNLIAQYFDIGLKEVEEYVLILSTKQIEEICCLYKHGVQSPKKCRIQND